MARLDVKAIVTAPKVINVPLVRADHLNTSNVFRVCFEVFLSLTSTLIGAMIAMEHPAGIYWVFVLVMGLATAAFLVLSIMYRRRAGEGVDDLVAT